MTNMNEVAKRYAAMKDKGNAPRGYFPKLSPFAGLFKIDKVDFGTTNEGDDRLIIETTCVSSIKENEEGLSDAKGRVEAVIAPGAAANYYKPLPWNKNSIAAILGEVNTVLAAIIGVKLGRLVKPSEIDPELIAAVGGEDQLLAGVVMHVSGSPTVSKKGKTFMDMHWRSPTEAELAEVAD